jgi:protein TonB
MNLLLRRVVLLLLVACTAAFGQNRGGNPPASEKPASKRPLRVRVSEMVSQALIVRKVQPAYPEEARHNHIQGNVVMKAEITQTGEVKELTVISGDPALAPAAVEAVKQWTYKPYKLNGDPVELETQVTVAFKLSGH